jgi:hypothetical protein
MLGGLTLSTIDSWPLYILAVLVCCEVNFMIGVWASLQFWWLHLENPSIFVTLERLLFAYIPFIVSVIWTWGVVAAV